eukprot:TRINITY_DN182_c0_g1_i4.p2 TRINITY_DN182_c0_g1~~TRINITY_DN182_c0_g1_i4.p2  ORF type:complete len:121 (+),score=24.45 TRINITY_DN182_c0_g1_i4:219-581(+)
MKELSSRGQIFQGAKILDVGCGVGGGSIFLTKTFGAECTAITISSTQVQMATENAKKNDAPTIKFLEMDAENISLVDQNETFDFVWIVEAMSHFPNKDIFLSHANRLLKPGGKILIADWV